MDCYHKMYAVLFNTITNALELLEQGNIEKAKQELMEGQLNAEDIFIEYFEIPMLPEDEECSFLLPI